MRPGDVVANRFQIEAVAGTGGMGTVYRARDLVAGELVALKTLTTLGERDAARFAREAAVLAELVHPGIVRYVAHGLTAEHAPYMVMEWIDGETLHARLQRGRLAVDQALALARAVADAIGAAHRRGVVHRDLKPMNLLLVGGSPQARRRPKEARGPYPALDPLAGDELARVKVLDFGIARYIAAGGLLTNTGTVVGTPGYMAPEQVRGETAIDARTDVFALGCVLYRCLTGASAFGGDHGLAVLAKILVADVVPPSALAGVPPEVDRLVLALLAKEPLARPADGRAVVAAIDALEGDRAALAPELGVTAATQVTTASSGQAAITGSEQRLVSIVLAAPPAGAPTEAERVAALAGAFGGRLERFADGALLVLFAHADIATDHAARAARCALALRDVLPALAIVVASGRATVERSMLGDVLDRAVATIRDIASGQIAIDGPTASLLDERFAVAERDGRTYLRALRDAGEPARTLLGRATPIVGRDRELATLEGLWVECSDEKVARAVLVTAPPGAGKSRLRHELVRRVLQRDERAELLLGRGDSLRAGSPFAIVGDAIRRAAGVREGDSLADQRVALCGRIERAVAAPERDRIAHLLGELAGVAFPTDASEALRAARGDAVVRGDAMRTAWVDWLAAECARAPVLLVLEDLHWGDRSSIELVDAALRELAQAPLLVLALARGEVHDAFPRLWAERALIEIRLPQLTRKASERLACELLGTAADAATIERIVERSNGNAFFLEELIRAVAEGRGDTLPDSVLSMLQLRLDALGGDGKRVLRAASVFGETFWHGGVAQLLDRDPRDELDALVQRELVARAATSQLPGETEYAFRHDLVREAAYAMMNAQDRVLAHAVAADWLVAHGHRDAIELARHYTIGEQHQRAAEQYARAAEQALAGHDNAAALAHVEHGLASSPAREVAARLNLISAQAHNWNGEHAAAIAAATTAREGFVGGTARWFQASDELFYAHGRLGEIGRAIATLHDLTATVAEPSAAIDQLRSVARAAIVMFRFGPPDVGAALVHRVEALAAGIAGDLGTEQRLCSLRAMVARSRGEAARCIAEHEAALRACELSHNQRELAFTYLAHAGAYTELGAPEIAVPFLERGIAVAERVGATTIIPLLYFARALAEVELGQHADCVAHARHALALCTTSDRAAAGLSHWVIARAALATGELATAEAELAAARELLAPFPDYETFAVASAARIALARGDIAAARVAATDARARMRAQDGFQDGEAFVRLVEIEVLEAAGDAAAAREAAVVAVTRLTTRAAKIDEPWRSRFLARPDHAATLLRSRSS